MKTENEKRAAYLRRAENTKGFNALQLAAILASRRPDLSAYQVAGDAAEIYRLAQSQARLALASCNYGLSERQEKRQETIAKEIGAVAEFYKLTAQCFGDPRGYTVKLNGKDIRSNSFGGDGFGVA